MSDKTNKIDLHELINFTLLTQLSTFSSNSLVEISTLIIKFSLLCTRPLMANSFIQSLYISIEIRKKLMLHGNFQKKIVPFDVWYR